MGKSSLHPEKEFPIANERLVRDGLDTMRKAFEDWINETIERGETINYVDGAMIAHNFYKLVLSDIASNHTDKEEEKATFYAMMLKRLSQSLLSPEESQAAEEEIRKRHGR